MNLCFDALDLSIIRGYADEPAVQGERSLTRAQLLEQVGALAGLFRGVGVEPGTVVVAAVEDPFTELLALLATARLGATFVEWAPGRLGEHQPHVVLADRELDYTEHAPGTVVLHGVEARDPMRDVPWEMAMKAGRSDPAGSVPGDAAAVAWVAETSVTVADAAEDRSRYGEWVAALVSGQPVTL